MYCSYRQLLEALKMFTEEELDMTATIYDKTFEAFMPVDFTSKTEDDDVLDTDHPIIVINDPELVAWRDEENR